MELEGFLPCSQDPATGPVLSQVNQSTPFHPVSLRFILMVCTCTDIKTFLCILIFKSSVRQL